MKIGSQYSYPTCDPPLSPKPKTCRHKSRSVPNGRTLQVKCQVWICKPLLSVAAADFAGPARRLESLHGMQCPKSFER